MSWKNKIAGSFGNIDQIFAVHPLDERRAIELLLEAKIALASLEEIEEAIRAHLEEQGTSKEHAEEQITKVRKKFGPWF